MASFDFITSKAFRDSLESDYQEMHRCLGTESWKSVQVLAGSIIEALLIDYLTLPTTPPRAGKDPLKLDLGEAVTICRAENVLSETHADLCSVVRSYRNLIHPGRMVRLKETPPDKQSAAVAVSLVDMIVDEQARARRQAVGLTAEQILSKLLRDASSLSILKHLLQDFKPEQRERLLVELLPNAHAAESESTFEDRSTILEQAYRQILESSTDEIRTRVAAEFVRVLREDDGATVSRYGYAFFRAADLKYVAPQHRAMVREHILSRVTTGTHTPQTTTILEGIGDYLVKGDVSKFVDPFVRTLISSSVKDIPKIRVRQRFVRLMAEAEGEVARDLERRLDMWIEYYRGNNMPQHVETIKKLKDDIDSERIPF